MNPGDLVNLTPFDYEYNPDRGYRPRVGIFLGLIPDKSHFSKKINSYRVLCADGCYDYLTSRWSVEVLR